jgi:ABC-type long-subunit fatty acid transport system fused permease/ATPase subunit
MKSTHESSLRLQDAKEILRRILSLLEELPAVQKDIVGAYDDQYDIYVLRCKEIFHDLYLESEERHRHSTGASRRLRRTTLRRRKSRRTLHGLKR